MTSVCPVNWVLEFGIRGKRPHWMSSHCHNCCGHLSAIDQTPSACLTDTFSKHSTHDLSFNECAVASNKGVSTHKEARSDHVEISKMEVQDEWDQERTAPKPVIPQSLPDISHVFWSILNTLSTCLSFGLFYFSMVSGKLSPLQLPDSPPPSAVATCPIPRQPASYLPIPTSLLLPIFGYKNQVCSSHFLLSF